MKKAFAVLAVAAAIVSVNAPAHSQSIPSTGAYAIVDARIEIGDGRTIEQGTVVVRNGLIQAVGKDVKVPADAEVIKGKGMVVYPGFIDAGCSRGLTLPTVPADQDTPPDTASTAPASMRAANRKWVRPELKASDCLALTDAVLDPMRRNGFTSALLVPTGGIMAGTAAVVNLAGMPKRDSVLIGGAASCMAFSPAGDDGGGVRFGGGGGGYPGSLLGIIAELRQTMLDAAHHRVVAETFRRSGGAHPPYDDSLDSLSPALEGAMPVVFVAESKREIERTFRLADEFHLHLMVLGAGEAWKETAELKKRGVPVLLSLNLGDEPGVTRRRAGGFGGVRPGGGGRRGQTGQPTDPGIAIDPTQTPLRPGRPNANPGVPGPGQSPAGQPDAAAAEPPIPDDTPKAVIGEMHDKWMERAACAAKLQQAGVPFALTTAGMRTPTDFWTNLRQVIKSGLPKDAALRALTLGPAQILGLEKQLGTVETGKLANLLVMSGDLSETASRVKYVIIDRSKFEVDTTAGAAAPAAPAPIPLVEPDVNNDPEVRR